MVSGPEILAKLGIREDETCVEIYTSQVQYRPMVHLGTG